MSDKNPFLEDKEKQVNQLEEAKIGFSSVPVPTNGKKIERYQDKLPGRPLRRITTLLTVFGIIFTVISTMYYLLPIFSAIIGAIIAICIVMFMIVSVVFTLGMILVNDGYREWIGNNMMDVPNFFFNLGENVVKLAPYYLVSAIPALIFTTVGLILAIVGQAKKYRSFIPLIVLNSIFLSFAIFFTALYFIAGMKIFNQ